jgi:hypothetical protein
VFDSKTVRHSLNTTWSSHEPASILHELVFHANYESMQFLIDHGIDGDAAYWIVLTLLALPINNTSAGRLAKIPTVTTPAS